MECSQQCAASRYFATISKFLAGLFNFYDLYVAILNIDKVRRRKLIFISNTIATQLLIFIKMEKNLALADAEQGNKNEISTNYFH